MRSLLSYPLLWALLVALWLVLNQSTEAAHLLLGSAVALIAVRGFAALQGPQRRPRKPLAILEFVWLFLVDMARSNVDVARIVFDPHRPGRRAGFVDIPLELRSPTGLAVLACVITSTPGTSWAGYDSTTGVLVLHVLDVDDEATWVATIKERYERRLMEIFE